MSLPCVMTATERGSVLRRSRRALVLALTPLAVAAVLATAWVGLRGWQARAALTGAIPQVAQLRAEALAGEEEDARATLAQLQASTGRAHDLTSDPVWTGVAHLPWVGPNLAAVAVVAAALDDLAQQALPAVVESVSGLEPADLLPVKGQFDLAPIQEAAPGLSRAAVAMAPIDARLAAVETAGLLDAVATPVAQVQAESHDLMAALQTARTAAALLPSMLGADGPRSYLLMLQTNAELRATGGMPGALSVLTADDGRVALTSHSSASAVYRSGGEPVALTPQDKALYTDRMGTYMADVNFTPDFPTAAGLAAQLWRQHSGQQVDGVLATDPVALSYLLAATGPVDDGAGGTLDADGAVSMLLSGAYTRFPEPVDQDAYFATVAANVFTALVDGRARVQRTIPALTRAAGEHRLLVWSAAPAEQDAIARTGVSGAMPGDFPDSPSAVNASAEAPASVGVFFNDGTGSKMDFYLNTRISVTGDCSASTPAARTVRVTLANDAPANAAQSLSSAVTGAGLSGAARGQIETSVVLVGPHGGQITGVLRDGRPIGLATREQSGRPATVLSVLLSPGEQAELEITMLDPRASPRLDVWSTPTKDQPGFSSATMCAQA